MSPEINSPAKRIQSVDLLRGAVMVIMAIDHVRVYSGLPAGGPDAGIFLTRWITHFCAPAFAFYAGTSAFLYLQKTGSTRDVAKFLLTRGLLLVVLELTLIRFFWTFNLAFSDYMLTGVIWMLGWTMVFMAAFVGLRIRTLVIIGLLVVFLQQVFALVPDLFPASIRDSVAQCWGFFYPTASGNTSLSGTSGMKNIYGMSILYVLLPWIGVMMLGFAFGQVLLYDRVTMRKICFRIGLIAIGLYITVGCIMILMNPEGDAPFIFKLLGQQKYPPSQLYLLMTLGPIIALTPWAEKVSGWFADALKIIGRVPMFYYLLHILLIHLSAFIVNLALSGTIHQEWYATAPLVWVPDEERWSLPMLYFVWFVDVVILYFASRWYAKFKAGHLEWGWLRYL